MDKIIDVIETALRNNDCYSAMYVTLALVGTCSRKQFPNEKKDWKCYQDWLDNNYKPFCQDKYCGNYIPSATIYQLRCSILHESSTELKVEGNNNNNIQHIIVTTTGSHFNFAGDEIQIDAKMFIKEMVSVIKIWIDSAKKNAIDTTVGFDIINGKWSTRNNGFKNCL